MVFTKGEQKKLEHSQTEKIEGNIEKEFTNRSRTVYG